MKFENVTIEKSEWKVDQIKFEPDSCPKTWSHYKIAYSNGIKNYNFEKLSFYTHYSKVNKLKRGLQLENGDWLNYVDQSSNNENNRLFALRNDTKIFNAENNLTYIGASYRYGGECDFNFNEKKCELFNQLIGNDSYAIRRLEACKANHHSLINFSLIQAMGNMQGFKGANRYDRLDVFINKLDQYFRGVSNDIVGFASEANRPYLVDYLNEFKDIYDYCQTIYFIDSIEFVDEIIKQGALPIDNCRDVIRYMNLADEFWGRKQIKIEEIYKRYPCSGHIPTE